MKTIALLLILASLAGCSTLSNTEKGALIGAATGAVSGAATGQVASGEATKGGVAGAILGGAAGAFIGHRMDKEADRLEEEYEEEEGVVVERERDPETGETTGINLTFGGNMLFDFDSAALRRGGRENLRALADALKRNPDARALLVGHTDKVGSQQYNLGLSRRRASAARRYLLSQDDAREGRLRSRVEAVGRGENDPAASNETAAGRQENRRVEIALRGGARKTAGDVR